MQAYFLKEKDPEFGQCVHKVVRHPSRPDRMFLQHHFGIYRSDDGGDSWREASKGVPSDFGFPVAMHPHDAEPVYVPAVAFLVLGMAAQRPVTIDDASPIDTSFPGFVALMNRLGAQIAS